MGDEDGGGGCHRGGNEDGQVLGKGGAGGEVEEGTEDLGTVKDEDQDAIVVG